jgi:predicted enzyme related to lactoylglutathione lyase
MPTRLVHVVIDAADPERQARFWSEVFGWEINSGEDGSVLVAPGGWRYGDAGPLPLLLTPSAEPKAGRNRLHLDLMSASAAHQDEQVARITGLGATPADIGQGDVPWKVLADPEGNEFCVLEARPRAYADTGPVAAVVVASSDPAGHAAFWAQATGWQRDPARHDGDLAAGGLVAEGLVALRAGSAGGPFLELLRDPDAAGAGARVRLDVAPLPGEDPDQALAALLAAGARPSDSGQPDAPWWLLSGPEGTEFRVLTPRLSSTSAYPRAVLILTP